MRVFKMPLVEEWASHHLLSSTVNDLFCVGDVKFITKLIEDVSSLSQLGTVTKLLKTEVIFCRRVDDPFRP